MYGIEERSWKINTIVIIIVSSTKENINITTYRYRNKNYKILLCIYIIYQSWKRLIKRYNNYYLNYNIRFLDNKSFDKNLY